MTYLPESISRRPAQVGVTLVELMIAMVLGLFLMAGLLVVFNSTQQSYRAQEAMSRIQESGRIAVETLARDIREAGHTGCAGDRINNLLNTSSAGYDPSLHSINEAFVATDAPAGRVRGDWISIVQASSIATLTANGNENSNGNAPPIRLSGASGVPQGTIVVVVDEQGGTCDLFQQTTTHNANNLQRAAGGQTPGNRGPQGLAYSSFNGPIEVFGLTNKTFFIGDSAAQPGTSSLYRLNSADNAAREIVSGVFDMRVEYGVAGADGRIAQYVARAAVTDWSRVAAARIHLLFYSEDLDNVVPSAMTNLPFANGTFNAPDRRMYQSFTTTIVARNRIN